MRYNEKLKAIRDYTGLSIQDYTQFIDIPYSTYVKVERGLVKKLKPNNMEKITNSLGDINIPSNAVNRIMGDDKMTRDKVFITLISSKKKAVEEITKHMDDSEFI